MDETKTSLMMKFEQDSGAIEAECPLSVFAYDDLAVKAVTVPIKNGTPVQVPGFRIGAHFPPKHFLISTFAFAAELSDGEKKTAGSGSGSGSGSGNGSIAGATGGKQSSAAGHRHSASGLGLGHREDPEEARKRAAQNAAASSMFSLWRSAKDGTWNKDGIYAGHIRDFSFTRLIDRATSTLFNACCKGTGFKSASLLKRKASASLVDGSSVDTAYLRLDFAGVKITSLEFEDGDVIEETCKFTCDGMLMSYARQDASGKLWYARNVSWSNPMTDTTGRAPSS